MNAKVQKCPYHDVGPTYSEKVYRDAISRPYVKPDGKRTAVQFSRLVRHRWFCPMCEADATRRSTRRYGQLRLGKGYCSLRSEAEAMRGWNAAVSRLVLVLIRRAAKGKLR